MCGVVYVVLFAPFMQTCPAVEMSASADDRLTACKETYVAVEVLRVVGGTGRRRTGRFGVGEVIVAGCSVVGSG